LSARLLAVAIDRDTDVVVARKRAREIAELVGFERQDQSRITTAVSEIARNAFEHGGGGRVEFTLLGAKPPQSLEITVTDRGRGIPDVQAVLDGLYRSPNGMGVGLQGARRLMDHFSLESPPGGGVRVVMRKELPRRAPPVTQAQLRRIGEQLAHDVRLDPVAELARQNKDLLLTLEEVRRRGEELDQVNQELSDTNRGVVALYAELEERAEHLRRADDLKSRFLSNMSHEFRTPLNSILALARLLLGRTDGELTAEQETQVRFILRSAENLTELVNDLLDLAKVEAGKTEVRPAEFTVESLFGALRGVMRPLLPGDAVALVFDDASALPPLETDEGKVAQILRNLISNAIKFTAAGEVRVGAQVEGDTIVFTVRDTGTGIAEEHLNLIFQEFAQVGAAVRKDQKGTGLGLPLSKRLAELLGGSITVASCLGEGSTFRLVLPRVYKVELPSEVRLLVVDDEETARYIVRQSLRDTSLVIDEATSGAEAIRKVHEARPDVILLDLNMPGMTGIEVLDYLGRDPTTRDVPVLILTSAILTEEERRGLVRARRILAKGDFGRDTLLAVLKEALGPRGSALSR
jgi:signal transduction histidine kinase/CheY-like chemotaxis protein